MAEKEAQQRMRERDPFSRPLRLPHVLAHMLASLGCQQSSRCGRGRNFPSEVQASFEERRQAKMRAAWHEQEARMYEQERLEHEAPDTRASSAPDTQYPIA